MRLVLAALSRPITVVVALVAIALCAVLALQRMPVDIFPQVGDPAIYVAQPYGGHGPGADGRLPDLLLRVSLPLHHRHRSRGEQEHSGRGADEAGLPRRHEHEPGDGGNGRAMSNRARAFMPPGAVPPFITRFDAGSVAVGQLVFSSATHTQGELQDFALNRVRPLFATLPGVSAPPPFGGNQRTIVITLNPDKLQQYRISPDEAIAAVSKATLVMPSGNMWTGKLERIARTNAALGANLSELLSTPIRPGSGTIGLSARHRHDRERNRHRHRVRACERQANGLHPGDQARGCVDAGGDRRGEGGAPGFQESRCRTTWTSGWSSTSRRS